MNPYKQTEDWIRQTKPEIQTPAEMDSRILLDSYTAMPPPQAHADPSSPHILRRFFMKRFTKFAAAAMILIAAFLSLTLFDKTVAPAYALEQTIQALNAMRSIHAKIYLPGYPEPCLVWAKFHENGDIQSLRISQPETLSPKDGAKETTWNNDIAQVWSKKTNTLYLINNVEEQAREISSFFQDLDPKQLIGKLEQMQNQGMAEIKIDQPDNIDQPITITATLKEEDPLLGRRVTALVDRATKLVISLETLKGDGTLSHKNGHFEKEDFNRIEFFDYNQPFEDDIFTLNVPEDTVVINLATKKVGLSQGQMSIEDTAVEVVKRFLQSVINQDYETAGLMYGGVPADKIQEALAKQTEGAMLKVISIGKATIHPNPDFKNRAFVVPCTIEFSKNGQVQQEMSKFVVKEVDGQPGQWAICGENF